MNSNHHKERVEGKKERKKEIPYLGEAGDELEATCEILLLE